ncbi:unnamed protein product [Ilex paraguariensis]|uniref:Uncharacterized protein n=1 Tax=Ilex paraguariensis TaxID=185542 RepID=A0ABC8R637_9AQUA
MDEMVRASIIIYITIAILLLLLISHSPKHKTSFHQRHRRLKLRSNFTFSPPITITGTPHHRHETITFDPLVADIERKREDREWEKMYFESTHKEFAQDAPAAESQPEWEEFMDAEDYLNDEEKFNVTDRLVLLFPKIDVDPADGYLSEHEFTEWNLKQSAKEVMHKTEREFEVHDKNHDGFVSFAEYEPPSWVLNSGEFNSSGR